MNRAIHLLNIWVTVPHQNFRELKIPSCHSHVAFLRSLMWYVYLDRSFQQLTWKTKFPTCTSLESSPRIKKSSSQEVFQAWNQSPKASLQGEDLHPLSGSLRKLLDIRNAIHLKHWNPILALSLHPKHYLNKTFSHLSWLRFVAILKTFFKK